MADPNTQSPFPELDDFERQLRELEEFAQEEVTLPTDEVYRGTLLPFEKNMTTGDVGLAIPGAIQGMLDAASLPGRVVSGELPLDPTNPLATPDIIPEVTNLGLEMVGIGWAPKMSTRTVNAMKLKKQPPAPVVRPVKDINSNAPQDLETLETASDLYKAYVVDEKSTLSGIAERAGVPAQDDLQKLIDLDTQASAMMRVGEASRSGRLKTFAGEFNSPIAPDTLRREYLSLPEASQQAIDEYLKLGDFIDDMNLRIRQNIKPDETQRALATARQRRADLEQIEPLTIQFADQYRQVTSAVRDFMASGNNAMLSEKQLQALNMDRQNYVPIDIFGIDRSQPLLSRMAEAFQPQRQRSLDDWFLQSRDIESIENIGDRTNAIDALVDYTRSALRYKMENDVRGSYIDAIQNSRYGRNTIIQMDADEVADTTGRVVEVYKNGERTKYVSSKLQAELLKFDPYLAQYPAVFGLKRLFEHGTTGVLSLTFAPTTMIRDAIAGMVFSPPGTKGPGLETVTAPFRQLAAKTQIATAQLLQNEFRHIPFLDNTTRQSWARNLSDRYARGFYHTANEAGGFDASLMKTNIRSGRGVLREVAQSWDDLATRHPMLAATVRTPAAFLQGFARMYDAIQEAPRFATFINNVKAGADPADAVRLAKNLTGDTTRSGRVSNPAGQRITADVASRGQRGSDLAEIAAGPIGRAVEFGRETIPYVNPTVQGMRRLATRFAEDPVGVSSRAWMYVGMPTMLAEGWNNMLGPEYTHYAHEQRTERDQTMNMYIGVPGQDPRFGIEVPLPHELVMWHAPFSRLVGEMSRSAEPVRDAIMASGRNIFENVGMLGYPVFGTQMFAATGNTAPDSVMNPFQEVFERREDYSSFLPENVELMLRSAFGGITNTNVMVLGSLFEGGPSAMLEEFGHQMAARTPIVKNVLGKKTRSTAFTPVWTERNKKMEAYDQFREIWDAHYNPDRVGNRLRSRKMPSMKDIMDPTSIVAAAPNPIAPPKNPLYPTVGQIIVDRIGRNDDGMTGLAAQYSVLSRQLKLLKRYSAGNKEAFREYQKWFNNIDEREEQALANLGEEPSKKAVQKVRRAYKEERMIKDIYDELEVDLGDRDSVIRLIDYFEGERNKTLQAQVDLMEKVELDITKMLHQQGMLPPNETFSIERHLKPY